MKESNSKTRSPRLPSGTLRAPSGPSAVAQGQAMQAEAVQTRRALPHPRCYGFSHSLVIAA